MSYTAHEYLNSIASSLEDLRAAGDAVPLSILRDLDRHVEGIRNLWVEYRLPEGKTLVEVFAQEQERRKDKP
jgi:hypothetical protein